MFQKLPNNNFRSNPGKSEKNAGFFHLKKKIEKTQKSAKFYLKLAFRDIM